tara:strand:- start:706 stop:1011 length:306 start_codon:yes stop_codon:yes gene_type:complete
MIGIAISIKDIAEIVYRKENMKKNEEIKKLKEELDYVKKNSVMICGFSNDDDDDGEQAEELGVKKNETFFDFDAEGFVDDALYQLKCVLKYDRVFRNGEEE